MTAPTHDSADRVSFDIDGDSFYEDIERTAVLGSVDIEHGCGRAALSAGAANGRARDHFVSRLEAVGPDVRINAAGNIVGRWTPDGVDPDAAPVAARSYLNLILNGGIFDGLLGVYAAVKAARSIRESDLTSARPLEVVYFVGEEGMRSADGIPGSTVAAGKRGVDETFALTDGNVTLEGAFDRISYHGSGRLDASAWDAWVELHIEQNTRLGDAGVPLDIVIDITGIAWCHVSIEGQADHSGATEITACYDALVAANELVLEVERRAADIATTGSGTAAGTVGELDAEPSVVNVVPGAAPFHLDLRSVDRGEIRLQLDTAEWVLDAVEAHRGVTTSFDYIYDVPPTPLSERCRRVATEASHACDIETLLLHSDAGHDTMQVADMTDAILAFVASENSRSYSPRERADWADYAVATEVPAGTLARLATTNDAEMGDTERN